MCGMPVANDRAARFLDLFGDDRYEATLDEMSQRMCDGEGLPAICREWDVPYGRVMTWLMADQERYERYERALEVMAHREVDEALAIADRVGDKDEVPAAKLQVETRFKRARHHAREKYGEASEVRVSGSVSLITLLASLPRNAGVIEHQPVEAVSETVEGTSLEKIPEKIPQFQPDDSI